MKNSDVKLKHKVQLRKKVEEPEEVSIENKLIKEDNSSPDLVDDVSTLTSSPSSKPEPVNSKTWILIILGIVSIGIIGFIFFSKSCNRTANIPESESSELSVTSMPSNTTVVENGDIEEKTADDKNEETINPQTQSESTIETSPKTNPLSKASSPTYNSYVSNDVEAEAMKVIRGTYGVGQERKNKLGSKYHTIQSRVNELKREGIF